MSEDWLSMSAAELGRGIESGGIDARDLTETFLAAIDAHPYASRIYARTTEDRARAEATAARVRARAGVRRGPLDGVPVSWKDLFDTAGTATEAGSKLLAGRTPTQDASVVRAAGHAGLVCLGKTHMSELAFSGLGVNPVTATPPNLHDPEAAPGGSSSGAAASVAFGLAAAAIGSDTGGSVRVPAAWNDLVGFKAAHGHLSPEGVVPLCARFDSIGPLCRTVEDAALVTTALGGARVPDLDGGTLAGATLLVIESDAFATEDKGLDDAFADTARRLAGAGAAVSRGDLASAATAMPLSPVVFTGEAWGLWRGTIELDPDAMFHQIYKRFHAGADVDAGDYVSAWRELEYLRRDYLIETARYDAVLLPTTAMLAPPVARLLAEPDYFVDRNLLTLRNTRVANLLGLCALTLPTGTPGAGLMAMAPAGHEARLLRLGAALERALA